MVNEFKKKSSLLSKTLSPADPVGKTVKVLPQTGNTISIIRDLGRKAKLPGKRISKNGNVYWETRKNRSDSANKRL